MSDTLRINPPPPGARRSGAALDDKREWREGLADAEARIERLETALAAVVRALAYGDTTHPNPNTPHQHALCSIKTGRHLIRAARALGIDIDLEEWIDEIEP